MHGINLKDEGVILAFKEWHIVFIKVALTTKNL